MPVAIGDDGRLTASDEKIVRLSPDEEQNERAEGDNMKDMAAKKYCMNCGSEVREGSKFCESCGNELPSDFWTTRLDSVGAEMTDDVSNGAEAPDEALGGGVGSGKSKTGAYGAIAALGVAVLIVVIFAFTMINSGQLSNTGKTYSKSYSSYVSSSRYSSSSTAIKPSSSSSSSRAKPSSSSSSTTQAKPQMTTSQSNALRTAKQYLGAMPFSHSGLVEQLEYEGYSNADAVYAADNCDADWNAQAAKAAKQYNDMMGFSRQSLIEQLIYEGFTESQAAYGADSVGL